jgi:beta-lactamase class A
MKVSLTKMLILALILSNIVLVYYIAQSAYGNKPSTEGYYLLDPGVAEMEMSEYNKLQDTYVQNYARLRENVQKILQLAKGNYSFYFEDLRTGAWVGISERQGYIPASLIKIPVLAATMKKIEEKEINIDDYVEVLPSDIRLGYGSAFIDEVNNITVRSLITYICTKSDDTANAVLIRNLSQSEIFSALGGLGLPIWESADSTTYSPKQVANAFRSLYYASYLRRPYSNFALALLANNEQKSFIKGVLPDNVIVSH